MNPRYLSIVGAIVLIAVLTIGLTPLAEAPGGAQVRVRASAPGGEKLQVHVSGADLNSLTGTATYTDSNGIRCKVAITGSNNGVNTAGPFVGNPRLALFTPAVASPHTMAIRGDASLSVTIIPPGQIAFTALGCTFPAGPGSFVFPGPSTQVSINA